jgi:import inner membrane translocase subunit TIM44
MREIMGTIKESTVSSAVATTKRVREGMVNFKKEANNWDENVGAVKTCFNLTKHAWKKTFPSGDEEVRVKMERAKKLMQEEKAKEAKELSEEDLAKVEGS